MRKIALIGNPNVGKSTLYNLLTKGNEKTGNWCGKTVEVACRQIEINSKDYAIYDLPGIYSLYPTSPDEIVARDYIVFQNAEINIIVISAIAIERGLSLAIECLEFLSNVILVINQIDEADKRGIVIDFKELHCKLGVPVLPMTARDGLGQEKLLNEIDKLEKKVNNRHFEVSYNKDINELINKIEPYVATYIKDKWDSKWITIKLIENDIDFINKLKDYLGYDLSKEKIIVEKLSAVQQVLSTLKISKSDFLQQIMSDIIENASSIASNCVIYNDLKEQTFDKKLDKIVLSKRYGIPIMVLLLGLVFWITIIGANYPSEMLFNMFAYLGDKLSFFLILVKCPEWLYSITLYGIYRTLTWVVSVMMPPMMIFFPLFALLEDFGYLPRIAFNLDSVFKRSCASGKQSLTMCMGFMILS